MMWAYDIGLIIGLSNWHARPIGLVSADSQPWAWPMLPYRPIGDGLIGSIMALSIGLIVINLIR